MKRLLIASLALVPALLLAADGNGPEFNENNELIRPTDYREWVYLTSGLGMNYGPLTNTAGRAPVFDNVFVNPASYKQFLQTGKWPDKTIFILEIRSSTDHGSINRGGQFQTDLVVVEAAVKDEARFPEKWAYFGFPGPPGALKTTSKAFPKNSCFTCHNTNAAVENTFAQFYPTILEVAEAKGTVNASFPRPAPTSNRFYHVIEKDGWEKASAVYKEAKQKDPEASLFRESTLNRLGYTLLGAGKKDEAIELFRLTAAEYPASANAQDSLADAYQAAEKQNEAIAASKKAIALAEQDQQLSPDLKKQIVDSAKARLAKLSAAR